MASPVIFYQIWAFVAPGLYDEEKASYPSNSFSFRRVFIGGGLFCYYIVFPFAFNFFHQLLHAGNCHYSQGKRLSEFRHKIADCLWADFRNAHFYPFFLARLGILTAAMMRRARRYAIVIILSLPQSLHRLMWFHSC